MLCLSSLLYWFHKRFPCQEWALIHIFESSALGDLGYLITSAIHKGNDQLKILHYSFMLSRESSSALWMAYSISLTSVLLGLWRNKAFLQDNFSRVCHNKDLIKNLLQAKSYGTYKTWFRPYLIQAQNVYLFMTCGRKTNVRNMKHSCSFIGLPCLLVERSSKDIYGVLLPSSCWWTGTIPWRYRM